MTILTHEALKYQAPSIFSSNPRSSVSEKYKLIPTIDCINALEKEGFYPVSAEQSRARLSENVPYVKHVIRLRKEGVDKVVGKNIPEIVLINSHNGLCSYQMRAGIFRLVCTNGLVVGNNIFYRTIRHKGDCIEKVVESANDLIKMIPQALDIADDWNGITINVEAQRMYAREAALIKWEEDNTMEIDYEKFLMPRRLEDQRATLWNTFNTIQEKLINGGVYYKKDKNLKQSRPIKSVSEKNRVNVALWNLTEKFAEITK